MNLGVNLCYGLAVAFLGPFRKLGSRTPAITRFDSNEQYFAQRVADTSHYRKLFAPHVSFEARRCWISDAIAATCCTVLASTKTSPGLAPTWFLTT